MSKISTTIRLDEDVLSFAKQRAQGVNRSLTNYIETLIRKDYEHVNAAYPKAADAVPVSVFLAEPNAPHPVADALEGEGQSDTQRRQDLFDLALGRKAKG